MAKVPLISNKLELIDGITGNLVVEDVAVDGDLSTSSVQSSVSNEILITDSNNNQIHKLNNRIKENLYTYNSQSNLVNQYIHLKTNIGMVGRMVMFKFMGYAYQQAKPIDASVAFYAYASTQTIIGTGGYGSHTCSAYKSTDGFAVITILLPNLYYAGFSVSCYQNNPIGVQSDVQITAATNSASATGVY